jgi:ABC-type branched-subunit amino acid transport system permease subunit
MKTLTGGIDLSVGSILALGAMITGWLSHDLGLPLPLAIVIGLLIGAGCGLVNGLLITRAKLPPFIATLSMMTVARGVANLQANFFNQIKQAVTAESKAKRVELIVTDAKGDAPRNGGSSCEFGFGRGDWAIESSFSDSKRTATRGAGWRWDI